MINRKTFSSSMEVSKCAQGNGIARGGGGGGVPGGTRCRGRVRRQRIRRRGQHAGRSGWRVEHRGGDGIRSSGGRSGGRKRGRGSRPLCSGGRVGLDVQLL